MGAWIEIISSKSFSVNLKSHPTMGAWIEIFYNLIITKIV